jgi:hypothetical protein
VGLVAGGVGVELGTDLGRAVGASGTGSPMTGAAALVEGALVAGALVGEAVLVVAGALVGGAALVGAALVEGATLVAGALVGGATLVGAALVGGATLGAGALVPEGVRPFGEVGAGGGVGLVEELAVDWAPPLSAATAASGTSSTHSGRIRSGFSSDEPSGCVTPWLRSKISGHR